MKDFQGVADGLGITPQASEKTIGDDPPLNIKYNAAGGGYTASLVFNLNSSVHVTIYQTSWDGTVEIPDLGNENVNIGPYCLHLTAGNERWFRQYSNQEWQWVTDYGTPTQKCLKAFDAILHTMEPYLV